MNTNGQHGTQPAVNRHDPAVVARLAVIGAFREPEALADLDRMRPDLDVDLLRLVAEVAAAVYADMLNPAHANHILHGRTVT